MSAARITCRDFGVLPDGRKVDEYTLDNGFGVALSALTYGGIVTAIRVPDREGRVDNVVLGFATLDDYIARNPHFGTITGRYANRIAGARFVLDGQTHRITANDGPNSLHGGERGFGRRLWTATERRGAQDGSVALELAYSSAHEEEGYPGRLEVTVRYTLTAANEWRIDYRATTDRPTVINLTHHDYFNLAGRGSALDHSLMIAASRYAQVDRHLIPVGIAHVAGTPFDFRSPTRISQRIRDGVDQLVLARGYDHNWILDRHDGRALALAARLEHEASGRALEIDTTEPAIQFYSGNFLDSGLVGPSGQTYRQGDGLCLETQHYPDSPNQPEFPSTVLRPGEMFESSTLHRFIVS
jgi:aldose 1-epimerase